MAASAGCGLRLETTPCHKQVMTPLLEMAFAAARGLPPAVQDDVARLLLRFVGGEKDVVPLTRAESAAIEASLAAAGRGGFATDEEVEAVRARHGL